MGFEAEIWLLRLRIWASRLEFGPRLGFGSNAYNLFLNAEIWASSQAYVPDRRAFKLRFGTRGWKMILASAHIVFQECRICIALFINGVYLSFINNTWFGDVTPGQSTSLTGFVRWLVCQSVGNGNVWRSTWRTYLAFSKLKQTSNWFFHQSS